MFLLGRGIVRNAHVAMIITGRIKSSQPNPSARVMDWPSNPGTQTNSDHSAAILSWVIRDTWLGCLGLLGTLGYAV